MKIEDFNTEQMAYWASIPAVTLEAAIQAKDRPEAKEAEKKAEELFKSVSSTLPGELVIYRRKGIPMGSALEFAVIRHIARRFLRDKTK